jgi:cytochrome c
VTRSRLVLALMASALGGAAFADDDAATSPGERAFQYCFSCHSVVAGEFEGLQGPNLAGIVGRPIAAEAGFDYSPPMRAFAARFGRWSLELLDRFIADTDRAVPGSSMDYAGVRNNDERAALLAYLATSDR